MRPMESATNDILRKISDLGDGAVFTPKDLLDVAGRGMVDMTLKKLLDQGRVRRLARGLYDSPKHSILLHTQLSPDIDAVAQAIARRFRWRIVPSGAHAANLLGLSTQVPAKVVYLANGIDRTKTFTVGSRALIFKASRPRDFGGNDNPLSAVVIQALRHFGKDAIDQETIATLRARLPDDARQQFLRDARYASDWIYTVAKMIARNESEDAHG
jgi:uncharacterized protein (DUF2267 family)